MASRLICCTVVFAQAQTLRLMTCLADIRSDRDLSCPNARR